MAAETSKVSKEAIFLEQSCRKLEKGKKRNTLVEKKNMMENNSENCPFEMGHQKSCILENGASEMAYLLSGAIRKG